MFRVLTIEKDVDSLNEKKKKKNLAGLLYFLL